MLADDSLKNKLLGRANEGDDAESEAERKIAAESALDAGSKNDRIELKNKFELKSHMDIIRSV